MTLLDAIVNRDNCFVHEAKELIDEMVDRISDGEDPEEVLLNEGFEPDYLQDLLNECNDGQ